MDVTKVVGFDIWIPKHFSLNFYDFSTFYMEFTSLLFLKTKEKGNELLHQAPGTLFSFNPRSLVGPGTEEGRAALFRRGEAPEVEARLGENGEGVEEYL